MNTDPLSAVLVDGRVVRIRLEAGRIAALDPVAGPARAVALPLPVEPHVHLDKTGIIDRCGRPAPGLFGAIEATAADKANWTEADLRARAGAALQEAWENGVAALRTHVDWDGPEPPVAWQVIGDLAAEWAGRMSVQRAALTALDQMGDADAGPRIAARVARDGGILGAFVYRNEGLAEKLGRVFDLARAHDLDLDFHVDEGLEPEAQGFDAIVALTEAHGMGGRVLAGHGCALSVRPEAEVAALLARAAGAGVALTVQAACNLHLQDMTPGRTPRLRGIAPVAEALAAGMEVMAGTDNVADPFYPYGSYDPLDSWRTLVLAAHLDPAAAVDLITAAPARALGLPSPRLKPGAPADFITLAAPDWRAALAQPRLSRHVYRAGARASIGAAA